MVKGGVEQNETGGIRNSGIGKGNQAKNALLREKNFDNLRTGFRL